MSTTGPCWLNYSEQIMLRNLLKVAGANNDIRDKMADRIMELERDCEHLRAEIETLQCIRHSENSTKIRKELK